MKIKLLHGILIVDILSILLILSIIFIPSAVPRVILGLPFLLLFPGYTLVAALFVRKERMTNIERIALSCVMSIAVVGLIGFGLNYTSWGIKLMPAIYSISAFIFIVSAIALIRRAKMLKTNIFTTELSLSLPRWRGSTLNKSLSIILIIAIFGAIGALGYAVVRPKISERYTEFYILGINSKTQDYPTEYVMDNGTVTQVTYSDGTLEAISGTGKVTVGVVNHEQQTSVYTLRMTINDEPVNIVSGGTIIDTLVPIKIQQGEKWEKEIGIVPLHTGEKQKVELLLFKGADTTPEESLILWINVKEAE